MINWGSLNKRVSVKLKSWRGKIKKRRRRNVENSFITFDFWNADIKKKQAAGAWETFLILCKSRPDHWRHQEETRAWDGASFTPQNTLPVWLVKMWNEEQGGSKLFKRVWGAQAETGPGPGRANNTLLWTGASGRQWACNATRFSCRLQKIPLSQHTCRSGAKERQGVLEGGRVVNIRTRGRRNAGWRHFRDLTSSETSLKQVMTVKTSFQNYLLSRMWKT